MKAIHKMSDGEREDWADDLWDEIQNHPKHRAERVAQRIIFTLCVVVAAVIVVFGVL